MNDESLNYLLARIVAVFNILGQKGLLDGVNVENEIAKATSQLDQEISRQKSDFLTNLEKEDPDKYKAVKFLSDIFGDHDNG